MTEVTSRYVEHFSAVMRALTSRGLLLGSCDSAGKHNLMTIGWGALGSIWGHPMWTILVRPSRHTYRCIEHSGSFSVCVPTEAMGEVCAVCGSQSGRDVDKIARCGLTARPASVVLAPDIVQCPIVYECQVVHSNDIAPARLANEIISGAYMNGDYHRIYFGRILSIRIDPDAAEKLA